LEGTSHRLYQGMGALNENCVLDVKNHSHSVTAQLVVPGGGGLGKGGTATLYVDGD
jgi:arylsulfatase